MLGIYASENLLPDLVESFYLSETLVSSMKSAKIFVNPGVVTYIVDSVAIVSDPWYPIDKVKVLVGNGNSVISRVPMSVPGVTVAPYIIRPVQGIQWSGHEISWGPDLDLSEYSDITAGVLRFPKIHDVPWQGGSWLDFALHQVGINRFPTSDPQDLDLLKTKKSDLNWSLISN